MTTRAVSLTEDGNNESGNRVFHAWGTPVSVRITRCGNAEASGLYGAASGTPAPLATTAMVARSEGRSTVGIWEAVGDGVDVNVGDGAGVAVGEAIPLPHPIVDTSSREKERKR